MRKPNPPVPRILRRVPQFHVHGDDPTDVYLRRYTLLRTPWGNVKLHQFLRSDSDPCALHDHPWRFVTLVVAGGYREVMSSGVRWRPPGTLLYRPALFRHRIEVDRPAWSLVWVGRKFRTWGFWSAWGFTPFRQGVAPVCEEGR